MKTEAISRTKIPPPGEEVRVTLLPTFDYEVSEAARSDTDRLGIDRDLFPSVAVAAHLAYYNFRNSEYSHDKNARRMLDMRLDQLCRDEQEALENPHLPTVGFEIETPTLPFLNYRGMFSTDYRLFFNQIGIPRNHVNADSELEAGHNTYWEFSPKPSFSAGVQSRVISELIQGRFIPSLVNSHKPDDIQIMLDPNFVSMHINIGVPDGIQAGDINSDTDLTQLGIALALAYTSGERLEHRKQKQSKFASVKQGLPTPKNNKHAPLLVELKAMEVKNAQTYHALLTAQLVFAAYFASHAASESELAGLGKNLSAEIEQYLFDNDYTPSPLAPTDETYTIVRMAQSGAGRGMRKLLEAYGRDIKKIMQETSESQSPQTALV